MTTTLPMVLVLAMVLMFISGSSSTAGVPPYVPPVVAYTWTLVESPTVALHWPFAANSPNIFDSDEGLLGRIITETSASVANACELAPSYACASGSPPVFLMPAGAVEGPSGAGGGVECNRKVIACNAAPIPGAGHGGHPPGNEDVIGEYSYFVIHTAPVGTFPPGKGIGFFTGSYAYVQSAWTCNSCPTLGPGRDTETGPSLAYTKSLAWRIATLADFWSTQTTAPFGHVRITLGPTNWPGYYDAATMSTCHSGVGYNNLYVDLCLDGLSATGNFAIPSQKVSFRTYSVDMSKHSSVNFLSSGQCNPPDCYVQNVIIPAALAQSGNTARNVQVTKATSVLPANAPGTLAHATIDSILFAYTSQVLDLDGDTVEDWQDPCPNDATDSCIADLINGGNCPGGEVFCASQDGDLGCMNAFLCSTKLDVNIDCTADAFDQNMLTGVGNGIQGTEAFNTGVFIGPFPP